MRANSPAAKTNRSEQRVVRCAIYARKSTEEGLAQPFNSLDAQRESAEAYISSQRHMVGSTAWWCIKVDRLSRSLLDFARLIGIFRSEESVWCRSRSR